MKVHDSQVVRNTAEYIRSRNVPIHVIGEDISKDRPFYENFDSVKRTYILTVDKIDKFDAAADATRIYLSKARFYGDLLLENPDRLRTIEQDECLVERTEDLKLINCLVHEVNHLINRVHTSGGYEPTTDANTQFMLSLSPRMRSIYLAMDEYHAYKTAQGNLYGMTERDIQATIKGVYLKERVPQSVFKLKWCSDNDPNYRPQL